MSKSYSDFRRTGETVFLKAGVASIPGDRDFVFVNTGLTDPRYKPIISVTAYGEFADVNSFVGTTIVFPSETDGTNQWSIRLLRSVGGTVAPHEAMQLAWKVVGFEPVHKRGEDNNPDKEIGQIYSGADSFYSP